MYTRYTCIYTIYTPNTPQNTPYTPYIHPLKVLADEENIRRQAGAAASGGSTAGMPGVAAGGGESSFSSGTSTLVNAVDALPALMERKALGDAHLNILQVRPSRYDCYEARYIRCTFDVPVAKYVHREI